MITPIVIEKKNGWQALRLRELFEFRDLLWLLTLRYLKVRYRQTVIGIAWVVVQPLLMILILNAAFSRVDAFRIDNVPYPIFALLGLIVWNFFAASVQGAMQSVVTDAPIMTKVYFPRLLIPLAAILASSVDFILLFVLFMAMAWSYGIAFNVGSLFIVLVLCALFLTTVGISTFVAGLSAQYRDIRHIVPFFLQIGLFASPVFYASSLFPGFFQRYLALNPLVTIIESSRWVLLGMPQPSCLAMGLSGVSSLLLCVAGIAYFRQNERHLADLA